MDVNLNIIIAATQSRRLVKTYDARRSVELKFA